MKNCKLCKKGLGRNEHLVFLAIAELGDNGVYVTADKPRQPTELKNYINDNLSHLNNAQLHYRILNKVSEIKQ